MLRWVVVVWSVVAVLVCAGPAEGAMIFGSDLTLAPTDPAGGFTFVQVVPRTGAMVPVTAPADGVLTGLKVSHGAVGFGGTRFGFRIVTGTNPYVARPATPDGSTVPQVSLAAGAAGGISEYLPKDAMGQPTGVPIQAGEHIALSVVGSTIFVNTAATGGFYRYVFGDHTAGSQSYAPGLGPGVEILAQGTMEPDADRDGYGDETQDRCVGLPGSVSGCPRADLWIAKSATQSPGAQGNVTYRLFVGNGGPDAAPGVVVSDGLPAGQVLLSAASTAGGCSGGPPVSCSLGRLPAGASAIVTLVVGAKAGASTNTATVFSATLAQAVGKAAGVGDPNAANNSSSVAVNVAAPELSSVSASPASFRLGSLLPKLSRRAPVGTTIKFTLSEPASTRIEFLQSRPGRKQGKRCKAPTRANRNHKHCTRTVVAGRLTVSGHAGKNKLRFQGRVSKHKRLKPGRSTLRITATDPAGSTSKAKTTTITILKG